MRTLPPWRLLAQVGPAQCSLREPTHIIQYGGIVYTVALIVNLMTRS